MNSTVPAPLDMLRDRVLADPRLQAELAPLGAEVLAQRVLRLAGEGRLAVQAADIAPFLEPDPIGISALRDTVPLRQAWPCSDWRPVAVLGLAGGAAVVDWAHLAGARMADPFVHQTARAASARPFNRLFRYRMRLEDVIDGAPGDLPQPDGLIFHMSRCGSTLVAQMLAALLESSIVSEAPAVEAAARLAWFGGAADPTAMLQAMVVAFGRDGGRPFVLKLDFWQALALPLYRRAFPAVPWLFLSRDPTEVMVSQLRSRGPETLPHVVPGLGVSPDVTDEEQIAQALASVLKAALAGAASGGGLFLDHRDLPDAAVSQVLPHFGIDSPGAADAMQAVAARDAKGSRDFEPDGAAKRIQANASVRRVVDDRLGAFYARLLDVASGGMGRSAT